MTFSALLCHTAIILGVIRANVNGRIFETEVELGNLPCRFTSQVSQMSSVYGTEQSERIDGLVYADSLLEGVNNTKIYPAFLNQMFLNTPDIEVSGSVSDYDYLRLKTNETAWVGKYDIITPVRKCEGFSGVHHIEFGVRRIEA